ncbi:MAG: 50S ribosomal protein L13 [Patescibacteria group bacterium]|nr:50S ribosomal protein L13 [Patescibacteria group bacterium]
MNSKRQQATKSYYLLDCREKNMGRLATRAAFLLQGKNKTGYQPNVDAEHFVVMINCKEARFSGNKGQKKLYHRFSGYPGGISTRKLDDILQSNPEKVVKEAVYGMLPKNNLRNKRMKRLLVFENSEHGLKVEFDKKS